MLVKGGPVIWFAYNEKILLSHNVKNTKRIRYLPMFFMSLGISDCRVFRVSSLHHCDVTAAKTDTMLCSWQPPAQGTGDMQYRDEWWKVSEIFIHEDLWKMLYTDYFIPFVFTVNYTKYRVTADLCYNKKIASFPEWNYERPFWQCFIMGLKNRVSLWQHFL